MRENTFWKWKTADKKKKKHSKTKQKIPAQIGIVYCLNRISWCRINSEKAPLWFQSVLLKYVCALKCFSFWEMNVFWVKIESCWYSKPHPSSTFTSFGLKAVSWLSFGQRQQSLTSHVVANVPFSNQSPLSPCVDLLNVLRMELCAQGHEQMHWWQTN